MQADDLNARLLRLAVRLETDVFGPQYDIEDARAVDDARAKIHELGTEVERLHNSLADVRNTLINMAEKLSVSDPQIANALTAIAARAGQERKGAGDG